MNIRLGKMHTTIRMSVVTVFVIATTLTAALAIGLQYYFGQAQAKRAAAQMYALAASGISGFKGMLAEAEKRTPLRRNVTIDEVGNAAAFLCSDLASGISGEITHVDGGFSQVGVKS